MGRFSHVFVFLSLTALLLGSCGKKSVIKNDVQAETLAEMYGDGKHLIRQVTFPLDNSVLAFNTPLPGLGPIAGGVLKLVGDIFASNTSQGEMQLSYTYPIPKIPADVIPSVRLKRFFFYMKPAKGKRRWYTDWFSRYFLGQGYTTFDFLDKLAVRMSAADVKDPERYVPTLVERIEKNELEEIIDIFKGKPSGRKVIDSEAARDIILLKYHSKHKAQDTSSKSFGKIHYMETEKDPVALKDFFLRQPLFKGQYKRILLLEKSILIELSKDSVSEAIFQSIMENHQEEISQLGVNFIDTCTEKSCLEINVPDVNLVPIAQKGNALKLDAFLHAGSVPESFKLKGFVEFEVKIASPI